MEGDKNWTCPSQKRKFAPVPWLDVWAADVHTFPTCPGFVASPTKLRVKAMSLSQTVVDPERLTVTSAPGTAPVHVTGPSRCERSDTRNVLLVPSVMSAKRILLFGKRTPFQIHSWVTSQFKNGSSVEDTP